jgi:salicylate hydroxylase
VSGRPPHIVIAGGGIAGLTVALALARQGFASRVFERAETFYEVGAGLQLSPNATKLLHRLGLGPALAAVAFQPEAVAVRHAANLRPIARIPLEDAQGRWGAPYLVLHRADLQAVLLEMVRSEGRIALTTGVEISGSDPKADLLIGADGVWSKARPAAQSEGSAFSGHVAWRCTVPTDAGLDPSAVSVFAHRDIHLVAYPLRGGTLTNLVAVMAGPDLPRGWTSKADPARLKSLLRLLAPPLRELAGQDWTAWPIHTVPKPVFTRGNMALIGDAAHAMTPFAAQGAAMAIEDAWVLAAELAQAGGDVAGALSAYEDQRAPRIAKVKRRAALNHFAWHAWGPVALARDMVLKAKGADSLARDLDWLYGWEPV